MKCYNEETTRWFLRTRFSAEERGGREASLTSTTCLCVCLGGDNRQQLQQKMSSLGVARRLLPTSPRSWPPVPQIHIQKGKGHEGPGRRPVP